MEQGLAQQLTSPQGMTGSQSGPTIEDVISMLMQGATPEDLLQMGIPESVIMEAIAMIESQQGGGKVPAGTPQGLATSLIGM